MRVLALTNVYPSPVHPTRGPFNRHPLRLLGERHPVRVIVPVAWTDEWAARRRGGGPFPDGRREVRDGLTIDYPRYLFPPRVLRGWYGHCFLASVRGTFRRVADEFRPDVVLATWAYPDGWAGVRLARGRGVPVVVKVHGSDIRLLGQYPARLRRTADALRAADAVVAVSRDLVEQVVALGVDRGRVRLIYNGVDAAFRPGPKGEARARLGVTGEDPLLVFAGNLFPVKGVDLLIAALARLHAAGVPARLTVVGQGPLRPDLERQAAALGVADRVAFLGPLPQPDLADWYRAADLFVLPSRSEGVPNVLLEASACGCPWVASRVGGIPEIAHLGQSRLAPPEDPDGLAGAIRDSLGRPAAAPVPPRSWEAAVDELERLLLEVTASTHLAPTEASRA